MSIPIDRDNTGSVNINNINNEPMLKIVNKGNGKVDLNSASDKNALSIDANGVVSASDLTATNLTTSNLILLQPNLNIPANATISGTTTLNGVLDANSTADIADTLTLSKASGVGLGVGLDVWGDVDIGGATTIKGSLAISGSTRGTFTITNGTSTKTGISNSTLTVDSVILVTLKTGTLGASGSYYVSAIDPTANTFALTTASNVTADTDFNYVVIN